MNVSHRNVFTLVGAVLLCGVLPAGSLLAQGTLTGRVSAAETGQPLADATVLVLGTNLSAVTGPEGRFTLRGVRAGTFDVQVLHVGYRSLKKSVGIVAGSTTNLDFALPISVAQLAEVVTTATGQQRRVELGNAVNTLGDIAKRVEQTKIAAVADLLVARAPGVIVLPSPVVGGAPNIRIRGISSITLNNAPIWVVDGVRYLTNTTSSAGSTGLSLLNNLSPEEIEDIEIVKGPSAATLYGTNAANGVVVVTTRKGRTGNTRWTFTGESRMIKDRNDYQAQYANFGHSPANPTKNIRCQLSVMATSAFTIADGATCLSDSLKSYNALEDPDNTFIHDGDGRLFGVNMAGGTEVIRFFASANLDKEIGPIEMPKKDQLYYENTLHVPVSRYMLNPRQQDKLNVRTNLSAALNPKFDLVVSGGFGKSRNVVEPDNSQIIALLYVGQANFGFKGCPAGTETTGCGLDKPFLDPTGFPLNEMNLFNPGSVMQFVTTDDVQRFTGSAQGNWRPLSWLQNDGTLGIDLAVNDQFHVCRLNECPNSGATSRIGNVQDFKENRRNISAKLGSTGSWQYRPSVNLRTSVGAEYTTVENDNLFARGRGLAPGASTLDGTSTFVSYSALQPTVVKTLGYYLQEQVGLRDRMFLTVAARQDQNSAFGTKFQQVLYPKASLSWIISDESFFPRVGWLNSLRLRSAYGANGVQPGATDALQQFNTTTVNVTNKDATTGTDSPGLLASNPGNAKLKPETSAEFESGFEADVLSRRLHLDYTYYRKRTKDALIRVPIPASVAAPVTTLIQNVGSTQNWGHELQANATLVDSRRFSWDLTISASHNDNKWVSVGIDPATGTDRIIGAGTLTQQRKGDPLNSQWYRNYKWGDANKDGIIQQSEVQVDSGLSNHGVGFAKELASIASAFDVLQRKLRINLQFDYKGGGRTLEGNYFQCSSTPRACQETQDPKAPLWMQARAVATTYGSKTGGTTFTSRLGYFVPVRYWKFREISGALTLPDRASELLRAQTGSSLVFSMRNIHTWKGKFTGVDPEQNFGVNSAEVTSDFNTSPAPTYFTLRLNLKY